MVTPTERPSASVEPPAAELLRSGLALDAVSQHILEEDDMLEQFTQRRRQRQEDEEVLLSA